MRHLLLMLLLILLPAMALAVEPTGSRKKPANDRGVQVTRKGADSRRRVALVIGNSTYAASPLKNPANDARAMAATLRRLGFDVDERTDLGYVAFNEAVERFGSQLGPGRVGLFYYAGHGVQVGGNNYLIPVDAKLATESEVRYKAVDAGLVLDKMAQAKSDVNIVIMDACRDNPFGRSMRSTSRGLATMDAPSGTIIAYATAPGKTASDGDGRNGLYTAELVQALETPGLKVEDVFKRVLKGVRERSQSAQIPWLATSFEGDFYFSPPSETPSLQPAPVTSKPADSSPAPAQPAAPRGFTDPTLGMEFVPVKGGCFAMGDSFGDGEADEKPAHEVCVDGFSMGKYEVTVGQFRRFITATGYVTDAEKGSGGRRGCWAVDRETEKVYDLRDWASWQKPDRYLATEENHPVTCVSWNDVQAFITWLNGKSSAAYRLPTEAEWEYAARGGNSGRNYWGNGTESACGYANVADQTKREGRRISRTGHECSDGYPYVAPVGSFKPNGFGLYDLMGNVWEWAQDWYDGNTYRSSPRENPQGPSSGTSRVERGGGWDSIPASVRAAYRTYDAPGNRGSSLGFRLLAPLR